MLEIKAQFAARLANDLAIRVSFLGSAAPKELIILAETETKRATEYAREAFGGDDPGIF